MKVEERECVKDAKERTRSSGEKECNRKSLSELLMATSQSLQTLRNSTQRARREEESARQGGRKDTTRRASRICGLLSKATAT